MHALTFISSHITAISYQLYFLIRAEVVVSIPHKINVSEDGGFIQVCATLSAKENIRKDFVILFQTENNTGTNMINLQCMHKGYSTQLCLSLCLSFISGATSAIRGL